jgi:nitrogen fixation NifU-like protein
MTIMYSAKLLDYFEHPRNAGEVSDANTVVELSNPVCGDVVRFSARVEEGTIRELRFRAKGCVPAMACASALTELARGRNAEEAGKLSCAQLEDVLGGIPEASSHASQLAIVGLRKLLEQVR